SGDGPSDTTVLAVAKTTANTPGHTIRTTRTHCYACTPMTTLGTRSTAMKSPSGASPCL
ncbi:unnamed protein product, partial [Ascophyllum nodosum]